MRHTALRAAAALALALALPVLSGCEVVVFFLIAPFFPGQDLPPPQDDICPLLPPSSGGDPGPVPETGSPALPALDAACDIGSKRLQRLNRTELAGTLRDVTGVDAARIDALVTASFPVDDTGKGFDNNAEVLTTSPLFFEKLEAAALGVVDAMLARPGDIQDTVVLEGERGLVQSGRTDETGAFLNPGGSVAHLAVLQNAAGTYVVRARLGRAGTGTRHAELQVDDRPPVRVDVRASENEPVLVEGTVELGEGPVHRVLVVYPRDIGAENTGELLVDFVEVEGPTVVTSRGADPRARTAVLSCDLASGGTACARTILRDFGRKAWRAPLNDDDIDALAAFTQAQVDAGDTIEEGVRTALVAVLLAPRFLYRVELDPPGDTAAAHALTDAELATRLSYFLWSSAPDVRLAQIADRGLLQDPDILAAETRRMLDDARSTAFVHNFAGQWLFTRALDGVAPDTTRFPDFDEPLRAAMKCETELTFDRFLRDPELSALDLMDSSETFLNERLAQHYGLPPPVKTLPHGWGLADLSGTGRSGILTQAGLLTVTSHPVRTSPTKRGKWILENLLCTPPPPPPPGVEGLPAEPPGAETQSIRDHLERHRADPACASCHEVMDPLGFALEHYNAVGQYRASDEGFSIDDSGLYYGVEPFVGARGLAHELKDDPLLPMCMTERALTYALGSDASGDGFICSVDDIAARFADGGFHLTDLVVAIVQSPAFRMRRAETADEANPPADAAQGDTP